MTNYWVAGAGKCAMSALVDQIARSTGYQVRGHSENFYYTHEPCRVVHTNSLTVPEELPTELYDCILVIRRDVIIQAMERWVEAGWQSLDFNQASGKLGSLLKNTRQRIQALDARQWRSRRVIHTEDFLNHPQHELGKLGLTQVADLAPNRTPARPWNYLDNYKAMRQHLQDMHLESFETISQELVNFLNNANTD